MRDISHFLYHLVVCTIKLLRPSGVMSVAAENLILRQQLIVMSRTRKRSPRLTQTDRTVLALLAQIISRARLCKLATILKFHRAIVQKKYRRLYSAKSPRKPGPKGPDPELIRLVVDIKHRNPRMGYDRIAMQVVPGELVTHKEIGS
jgi:putative transposase